MVLERTNVRTLTPESLAGAVSAPDDADGWDPVDVVTADLSFISLTAVARYWPVRSLGPAPTWWCWSSHSSRRAGPRCHAARGSFADPATWHRALQSAASALGDAGAGIMGAMRSPITGPAGNTEFLLHAVTGRQPRSTIEVERCLGRRWTRRPPGRAEGRSVATVAILVNPARSEADRLAADAACLAGSQGHQARVLAAAGGRPSGRAGAGR